MTVNYYLFSVHVCHYFTVYVFFFLLRFRNVSTGPMFLESYVFQMYLFYTSLLSVSFLYTSKLYLTYEGKPVKFTKNLPVVVNLESYNQHSLTIQQIWTAFPLN